MTTIARVLKDKPKALKLELIDEYGDPTTESPRWVPLVEIEEIRQVNGELVDKGDIEADESETYVVEISDSWISEWEADHDEEFAPE